MSRVQDGRAKPEGRPRILVIEDDPSISLGLRLNLRAEGYEVEVRDDGVQGLDRARQGFDLLVLDLTLPRLNGFDVLRQLREEGHTEPVIVLSARGSELDKVCGLDMGADDYVTKPFALAELLARVRAALRRPTLGGGPAWVVGDVEIDPNTREVRRRGAPVELTATEFLVLAALCGARGRVLSRDQIVQAAWGPAHAGTPRTVDNFIAQLRTKLEDDPTRPTHLLTVRAVGYRLV